MSKFETGRIVMTRGVYDKIYGEAQCDDFDDEFNAFVHESLKRYLSGDWGDLCDEDKEQNEQALVDGERLMGSYEDKEHGWKIWIITEWNRSVTTILFPSEY